MAGLSVLLNQLRRVLGILVKHDLDSGSANLIQYESRPERPLQSRGHSGRLFVVASRIRLSEAGRARRRRKTAGPEDLLEISVNERRLHEGSNREPREAGRRTESQEDPIGRLGNALGHALVSAGSYYSTAAFHRGLDSVMGRRGSNQTVRTVAGLLATAALRERQSGLSNRGSAARAGSLPTPLLRQLAVGGWAARMPPDYPLLPGLLAYRLGILYRHRP